METKPICVIKVDNRGNEFEEIYKIQQQMTDKFPDYHVLVLPFTQVNQDDYEPIQLQVFYEKDFTEVKYQELKSIIEESLKNNKK